MVIRDKSLLNFLSKRGYTGSKLARDISGSSKNTISGVLQRAFKTGKFAKNRILFNRVLAFQKGIKKSEAKQSKRIKREDKKPIKASKVKRKQVTEVVVDEKEPFKDDSFSRKNKGEKLTVRQVGGSYSRAVMYSWSSICVIDENITNHDSVVVIAKPKLKDLVNVLLEWHFLKFEEPNPEYHYLEELLEVGFFTFGKKATKKIVYNIKDDQWYLRKETKVRKQAKLTRRIKL